ncbi:phosphatase PAP2 family protein [Candidatus Thorarchaeota archaeon]|nr:MAG: phosphatase PAP2 family protein [Candidatus Thorarchaeota archaeon]
MVFDPALTTALREALPWAGPFFLAITELGSETFYVVLILVGYWAFRKKDSIKVAYVLIASVVSNYWLKLAIANPRPDPTNWLGDYEASNYSTPSGHSQNSATLFGWIAAKAKMWWMYILSGILIFLIGISRVYIGVHYLGDVLLGWGVGILTVTLLYFAEEPMSAYFEKMDGLLAYGLLFIFGLLATIISSFLLPQPPGDNFGALGGLIMGLAIGLPLEQRYVMFETSAPNGQKWRIILRVLIGLILVLGVMIGLAPILVTENVFLRAIRYTLVVIIGSFVWPLIFKRVGF